MSPQLRIYECSVRWPWRVVFAALCVFGVAGPGGAQAWGQWEQTHKLTAADAAGGDEFGFSVAITGGIAIVGAPNVASGSSGSAYLFDVATGEQLHKLTAEDASADDRFGESVSISGGIAMAGAWFDDDACAGDQECNSGSAYLFDVATGQQLHKLTADDAAEGDFFGTSVSISGGIAIAGAWFDDDACPGDQECNSGSAYLFDVATGQQLHKLTAEDAASGDVFGFSVSVSDGIAIVGARADDDAGGSSGSAYLFDVATGQQLHKLTANDAAADDFFGVSVSVSGGIAIVGAHRDDDAGSASGSAYLFDVATGQQLHKLTANDAAGGDQFGISVSISGGVAIAGALYGADAESNSGSAYLFDVPTGQQLHKLTAEDAASGDVFGISVSISGGVAIVGASLDDDAGSESGSAYLFERVPCPADLNGDGAVDAFDLAILLGSWGPCQ